MKETHEGSKVCRSVQSLINPHVLIVTRTLEAPASGKQSTLSARGIFGHCGTNTSVDSVKKEWTFPHDKHTVHKY